MNDGPRQFTIRPYREADQAEVVALWDRCGLVVPWNDPLVRTTNREVIAFYERLGYSINDVTTLGKRLS